MDIGNTKSALVEFSNICEEGWSYFPRNNVCYKYQSSKKNFEDAKTHCNGLGINGHLVSVPDEETNNFIFGLGEGKTPKSCISCSESPVEKISLEKELFVLKAF